MRLLCCIFVKSLDQGRCKDKRSRKQLGILSPQGYNFVSEMSGYFVGAPYNSSISLIRSMLGLKFGSKCSVLLIEHTG